MPRLIGSFFLALCTNIGGKLNTFANREIGKRILHYHFSFNPEIEIKGGDPCSMAAAAFVTCEVDSKHFLFLSLVN
jgi:hypothetical protein